MRTISLYSCVGLIMLVSQGPAGGGRRAFAGETCQQWVAGPLTDGTPVGLCTANLGTGRIVMGGLFTQNVPNQSPAHNLVVWNGLTLSRLASIGGGEGTNGTVRALKALITGGPFGGTTSPASAIASSKLDVIGGPVTVANNYGFLSRIAGGNGIGAGIDTTATDDLQLIASGAERVRIAGNGNVGIGTTAPGKKLTVAGIA